jgi:hypothetical protein
MNSKVILILTLIITSFSVCGQTILKYKGVFPDPNKSQSGTATYEYFEDEKSHEYIKNGLFLYDFKGVDSYAGFNQNISGSFKDGKRDGIWSFLVSMNDFGVQNPYFTGTLKATTSYNNGGPDGTWTYTYLYRKRNKIYSYGAYKWSEFSSELKTEIIYTFKDGQLCGPVKIIDNDKGYSIEGSFASNGMLDGKWTIIDYSKGTTEVIEYKNSILFDSYKRNTSGEIIQRISDKDKKRFDDIAEIKKMTEEQRLDAGVHVDTTKTGFINDWCFKLAEYTNVFYEPVYFMPNTIGGDLGFGGLKEIVIKQERRTPLDNVSDYISSQTQFKTGSYHLAFESTQKIIRDSGIYNTLSNKDKNKLEIFSKTCNDSIVEILKRSSTNISYSSDLKKSIEQFGQNLLNSGIWKSNPFIIQGNGYYAGQTTTHDGNWYNRGDIAWSSLRSNYPIWTQLITDKYLEMKNALREDERNGKIVHYNFDVNGNYTRNKTYTYDIRDSSSFISKPLLSEYNKSIEAFDLFIKLNKVKNEVDRITESYDDKLIRKEFVKINDHYNNLLINCNLCSQLSSSFQSALSDFDEIIKYLKSNDKDTLKDLIKKSQDTPSLINSLKNK